MGKKTTVKFWRVRTLFTSREKNQGFVEFVWKEKKQKGTHQVKGLVPVYMQERISYTKASIHQKGKKWSQSVASLRKGPPKIGTISRRIYTRVRTASSIFPYCAREFQNNNTNFHCPVTTTFPACHNFTQPAGQCGDGQMRSSSRIIKIRVITYYICRIFPFLPVTGKLDFLVHHFRVFINQKRNLSMMR